MDAVVVVSVPAGPPGDGAAVEVELVAVRLTFDAHVHDLVAADHADGGAGVPGPEGDGPPALHLEALLARLHGGRQHLFVRRGGSQAVHGF